MSIVEECKNIEWTSAQWGNWTGHFIRRRRMHWVRQVMVACCCWLLCLWGYITSLARPCKSSHSGSHYNVTFWWQWCAEVDRSDRKTLTRFYFLSFGPPPSDQLTTTSPRSRRTTWTGPATSCNAVKLSCTRIGVKTEEYRLAATY